MLGPRFRVAPRSPRKNPRARPGKTLPLAYVSASRPALRRRPHNVFKKRKRERKKKKPESSVRRRPPACGKTKPFFACVLGSRARPDNGSPPASPPPSPARDRAPVKKEKRGVVFFLCKRRAGGCTAAAATPACRGQPRLGRHKENSRVPLWILAYRVFS